MIPYTTEYGPVEMVLPVTAERILPDFIEVPQDMKVTEGDKVVLKVRVIGQPSPEVTWFIDDETIEAEEGISLQSDGDKHQLVIDSAHLEDEGVYKCVAKNKAGKAVCEVELLVNGKLCLHLQYIYIYICQNIYAPLMFTKNILGNSTECV